MEWFVLSLLLSLVDWIYFGNHVKAIRLSVDASPIVFYQRVLSTQQWGNFRFGFKIAHGVLSPQVFEYGFGIVISDRADRPAFVTE